MKKLKFIVLSLVAIGMFSACEALLFEEKPANNPIANFDFVWNTVNERYALFETKNVNWDSIYVHFRRQITNQSTDFTLYDVCFLMLRTLQDGHVFIANSTGTRNYPFTTTSLGNRNFNRTMLFQSYLRNDFKTAGGIRYKVFNDVGYIFYESFLDNFSEEDLDQVFTELQGLKGLVIDVRDNGGGNPNLAYFFAARLATSERHVVNSKSKIGPGKDDFTPTEQVIIKPSNRPGFRGPIRILTNRSTFSAANLFVAYLASYDHVRILGTQSGGGGGVPAVSEMPNGWTIGYTTSIITYPNGYEIERGIPVNRQVIITNFQYNNGIDGVIEAAFSEIRALP